MKTSHSAAALNAPKILLVDDNRNGLIVRKALLEEVGCVVTTAGSGDEALGLFASNSFDLVVTDFRMPRMNGAELIQRIRGANPNIRVILLSGFVEPLGLTEASTSRTRTRSRRQKATPKLTNPKATTCFTTSAATWPRPAALAHSKSAYQMVRGMPPRTIQASENRASIAMLRWISRK